jgi:polyisoprenoid-binding protein YceI
VRVRNDAGRVVGLLHLRGATQDAGLLATTYEPKEPPMTTWNIDPSHSAAHFTVRHMMISNVRGEFGALAGSVEFDPAAPEAAHASATVETGTVNTRDEKRDAHLRSGDFFDVERHPQMAFRSTGVARKGAGYALSGELTIRGTTKSVTFQVEGPTAPEKDPWGNTRVGAIATATIDRREFGLVWNTALESGGVLVGHDVTITIDVSLVKA